jgi:hypothetical protein
MGIPSTYTEKHYCRIISLPSTVFERPVLNRNLASQSKEINTCRGWLTIGDKGHPKLLWHYKWGRRKMVQIHRAGTV